MHAQPGQNDRKIEGGSDEAARLFPQQRVLPGQNRVESEGLERRAPAASSAQGRTARPVLSRDQSARAGSDAAGRRGAVLTQSLAIIEWLDETHPEPPLLPKDPLRRAKVRAFAQALACDTHPVQNLKVLARLRATRPARGKGHGVGGLGQPRGAGGLRSPDRRRARPVLLRRRADHRRSLPGAAACQCAALRRRCRGLSAPAEGRGGGEEPQGVRGRRAGASSPMPSKIRP